MILYHYTDSDSARRILDEGILRAYPILIYRDLAGPIVGAMPSALHPVVWFTRSEEPSQTVAIREAMSGRPGPIWRFGAAVDSAPDDLPAWAEPRGYPAELFRWMLLTAIVAGEDPTDWRLASADVPRGKWLTVQRLLGDRWIGGSP